MPKLTNKCAICGTPILKSATICAKCASDKEARQREIDSQMEVYNVRLQSAFLWEKRRYEIAKEVMKTEAYHGAFSEEAAKYAVACADALIKVLKEQPQPQIKTMPIYDEKTCTYPLHEPKTKNSNERESNAG